MDEPRARPAWRRWLRWLAALTAWVLRAVPPVAWLLPAMQCAAFAVMMSKGIIFDSPRAFLRIGALSCLSVFLLGWLVSLLFARRPRAAAWAVGSLIVLYAGLLFYHIGTGASMDFAVIWGNRTSLWYPEVAGTIAGELGLAGLAAVAAVVTALVVVEKRWNLLSRCHTGRRRLRLVVIVGLAYAAINCLPFYSYDDLSFLLRSAVAAASRREPVLVADDLVPYPYMHDGLQYRGPGPLPRAEQPHVILVAMESMNANLVEARAPDGREYTPNLNRLIRDGLYVERFYGHSVQTAKGQFALIASVPPAIRGKVFTDYPRIRLRTLPQILKEAGYTTAFMQGGWSRTFDNTGQFLSSHGFDYCWAARGRPRDLRWGAPDDGLYRQFFSRLDGVEHRTPGGRYFGLVATISNHMPFRPRTDEPLLIPAPRTRAEHILNSIHIADGYLPVFFEELRKRDYLRNTVVIVTGDHSFPAGEHGNANNEVGRWEENFRTPFLILWPGKLRPDRIAKGAYSQVDVAPTITELLQIHGPDHFTGKSIRQEDGRRMIYLIQPYGGIYLAVVQWPLKYVLHVRTGREWLYDLAADPREERDVIADFEERPELYDLRRAIGHIGLNQRLIEQDRIWPPNAPLRISAPASR